MVSTCPLQFYFPVSKSDNWVADYKSLKYRNLVAQWKPDSRNCGVFQLRVYSVGPTAPQGKQESNLLQMSLYKAN
jgi:hypothetical protein